MGCSILDDPMGEGHGMLSLIVSMVVSVLIPILFEGGGGGGGG